MKLTLRQYEVLEYVKKCGVASSGYDGSVLKALAAKGLVIQHSFSQGQNIRYTWTLADKANRIDCFTVI